MPHHATLDWVKPGAPIAQVLNEAASVRCPTELIQTIQLPSASPFSGKLVDLLLSTAEELPTERRKSEEQPEEPSRNLIDGSIITLPQLPQRPAKAAKRPRIPPLLQGLHQPPPLPPTGRRFPPITDGVSGLERDICDRLQSGHAVSETRSITARDNGCVETDELKDPNEIQSNRGGNERDVIPSPSSPVCRPTSGNPRLLETQSTEVDAATQNRRSRKRKIWSDEETRDLLLGVSKFGIGSWKKILHCSDFKFNERTAVDLKDRFRVCYPSDCGKSRHQKRKVRAENTPIDLPRPTLRALVDRDSCGAGRPSNDSSIGENESAEGAGHVHRMSQSELARLGIQTPFAKSKRRPRHQFSALDDDNLLRGFEKYGAVWHSIRDDENFGFSNRHSTDLRDRFRIRYPGAYAKAGYKLKPKFRSTTNDRHHQNERQNTQAFRYDSNDTYLESSRRFQAEDVFVGVDKHDLTERSPFKASYLRPLAYTQHIAQSNPVFVGETSHAITAAGDGVINPIVLNRNISQWADANSSLMSTPAASSGANHFGNHVIGDMTTNLNASNDGLHINPLATLKLPSMAPDGHSFSTGGAHPFLLNVKRGKALPKATAASSIAHGCSVPTIDSTGASTATPGWTYFPRVSLDDLSRTPNLPTIVFPHVPATSARTTVHNFPTPADLLSGMDLEFAEPQVPITTSEHVIISNTSSRVPASGLATSTELR